MADVALGMHARQADHLLSLIGQEQAVGAPHPAVARRLHSHGTVGAHRSSCVTLQALPAVGPLQCSESMISTEQVSSKGTRPRIVVQDAIHVLEGPAASASLLVQALHSHHAALLLARLRQQLHCVPSTHLMAGLRVESGQQSCQDAAGWLQIARA